MYSLEHIPRCRPKWIIVQGLRGFSLWTVERLTSYPTRQRFKMFQRLKAIFRRAPPHPVGFFVDPVLGEFTFDSGLGWRKRIDVGQNQCELVIGSDGEIPSEAMVRTARMWAANWSSEKPRLLEYIRTELSGWTFEPVIPDPDRFSVESINVLWPSKPETCMIYFEYTNDEYRAWHLTLDEMMPRGFAYDD